MALEPIVSTVYLDIYDHDTTPTVIKTVSSDSQTRFVRAFLQKEGEIYSPDPEATAYLVALRPDRSLVVGPAELVIVDPGVIEEVTVSEEYEEDGVVYPAVTETVTVPGTEIYGPYAEITKEMTAVVGTITFQFKIVQGDEELRTEVFKSNNGINVENAGNCVIDLTE